MVFYLIGLILLLVCFLKDSSAEELKKDKKEYKRITGKKYQ